MEYVSNNFGINYLKQKTRVSLVQGNKFVGLGFGAVI
jgi:hypothetical protein